MRATSSSDIAASAQPQRTDPAGSTSLRRFATLRWAVIAIQLAAVATSHAWLDVHLPWLPMLLVIGLLAGFNVLTLWRLRR